MLGAGSSGQPVNTTDIFNATSKTWSTAALSVARQDLTATSLPNYGLAFFAGGQGIICPNEFGNINEYRGETLGGA